MLHLDSQLWFFLLDTGMSWDFFVPVCVGDLVKTGGINQYVVQDVVPSKQLPSFLSSKYQAQFL